MSKLQFSTMITKDQLELEIDLDGVAITKWNDNRVVLTLEEFDSICFFYKHFIEIKESGWFE